MLILSDYIRQKESRAQSPIALLHFVVTEVSQYKAKQGVERMQDILEFANDMTKEHCPQLSVRQVNNHEHGQG